MSKMLTEIKRVVDEDISNRVSQYNVIFEAITNSIHANSTEISCILHTYDKIQQEGELDTGVRKVDNIVISDNGDGLTDDNWNSFCKYRSEYKKQEFGGKGVGRFTFLKLYHRVRYESKIESLQEIRSFDFDLDFDTNNLDKKKRKIDENFTQVSLSSVTKQYFDDTKNIDRKIELDLNVIKEKVLLNLIPTIFFYKKKDVNINIHFIDRDSGDTVSITSEDIPDFLEQSFEIQDKIGAKYKFKLHHKIIKEEGKLNAFYCANNRTVCEFSDKDFIVRLPYGYSGYLLLESDYLNSHTDINRNDFDIFPIKTDMFATISWDMINTQLKVEIAEIVKEGIPETKELNAKKLTELQEERPYLVNFIDEKDIEMAGFLDKKQLIDKAKKKFDVAKEKVLAQSGREAYTEKDLEEAIQLAQNELVSYIFDRVQVIERLKTMVDEKEKVEKIIHNLFMQ